MRFCRRILPLPMTLLMLTALSATAVRSAKFVEPAPEQVKAPIKLFYILENPENFKDGSDSTLLSRSYSVLADLLKEEGRTRTPYNGSNYDVCGPNERCDKVLIQRYQQLIMITVLCNDKHTEGDKPKGIPSGELTNIEEIDEILMRIGRVLKKHDVRHGN